MEVYLETERLTLRRLSEDDVDNLYALDGDPEVMRYLSGGAPTPRDVIARDILPRFLRWYQRTDGYGYWAAIEKATGDFLGWFALHPAEDASSPDAVIEAADVELGYRLRRSAWGKGYATEGARALIERAFAELGARRIFATTYQDNVASRRVMEKVGMTLVRSFRLTPADLAAVGTFDTRAVGEAGEVWEGEDVEYALTREEWERRRRT